MAVVLLLAFACTFSALPKAHGQKDVRAVIVAKAKREPAPTFHLASSTGKTVQPADYKGKVVLLNFWATKCGGCVLEIPAFIDLQQKYEKSGFTTVGISSDVSYSGLKNDAEGWQLVRPFMASHKMNYPILMGNDSLVTAYGFELWPASYLIDKSGKIAATYIGVVDKNDVEANIKALLAER
jgi:peroxiredoxin